MRMENENKGKVIFIFVCIYLLFMTSRAIFNPYVTVYLQEKGFATEKIGLITGANSLVLIIAQPFWGIITDKLRYIPISNIHVCAKHPIYVPGLEHICALCQVPWYIPQFVPLLPLK